jgi:hypothetical protein
MPENKLLQKKNHGLAPSIADRIVLTQQGPSSFFSYPYAAYPFKHLRDRRKNIFWLPFARKS